MRRVIELIRYLERFRVVRQPRRILDVKDIVTEPLQADDVVNVLPDYAGNRDRAHEAHDHDSLALHREESAER